MSNAWNYFVGQCTYYAAQLADWIPSGLGNADTWVQNARTLGYSISPAPVVGSVAQWAASPSSPYGHVGVVTKVNGDGSFWVQEMNYLNGPGGTDSRLVQSLDGIAGFILKPGTVATQLGAAAGGAAGGAVKGAIDSALNPIAGAILAFERSTSQMFFILLGASIALVGVFMLIADELVDGLRAGAETAAKNPELVEAAT